MSEVNRYASDPCHSRFLTWVDVKHGGAELGDVVVAQDFDAEHALRLEAERQVAELREQLADNHRACQMGILESKKLKHQRDQTIEVLRAIYNHGGLGYYASKKIEDFFSTTSIEGKDHE